MSTEGKTIKRANPSTIQDKFLVGYQGWFTCPGDGNPVGAGHHGWLHWFNHPIPDGGRPNTDLWPDLSDYTPSELFPAPGLKYRNGEQPFLFSSRHPKTVQRHFHWMARHGVDGAFLQRFLNECDVENGAAGIREIRDEVGDRVTEAAEKEGRVFAIMYDVSGVAADRILPVITQDWVHLIRKKGVLDSPNYLREKGKPVVALWGFGMSDKHHDPAMVRAVTNFIRSNTPGGAYIMAGTPTYWRTSQGDADPNPEFVNVWLEEFDAISPWTIGRYKNVDEADRFAEEKIKGDMELIAQRNEDSQSVRKIDYIPVVFPGGSGFNLSEGKWGWNDMPRAGGNFLWRQLFNVRRAGVRTIYGAMWDEYDEGTAFMPVVAHKRQLPVARNHQFMALDEDGFDLPPDWYMRICGFGAESLRGERIMHDTFPSKELQDYWATRPRYEEKDSAEGSSSGGKFQSWEDWEKSDAGKVPADEPPPPPYSLETEEQPSVAPAPAVDLNRRPTVSVSETPVAGPSQPSLPPTAPLSTRPKIHSGSRPQSSGSATHTSPHLVAVNPDLDGRAPSPGIDNLIEDLGRTHLSPSPQFATRPPTHDSHPSSPHYPSHPSSPHRHSHPSSPHHQHHHSSSHPSSAHHSPYGPPQPLPEQPRPASPPSHAHLAFPSAGPGYAPEPGFVPNFFPTPSPPAHGQWAQAAWPPPEWGVAPQPQVSSYPGGPAPSSENQHSQHGYTPSYASSPPAAAPPLRPRPSVTAATRPSSHGHSDTPSTHAPYGSAPAPYGTSPSPGHSGSPSPAPAPYGSAPAPYGHSSSPAPTPYGSAPTPPSQSYAFPEANTSSAPLGYFPGAQPEGGYGAYANSSYSGGYPPSSPTHQLHHSQSLSQHRPPPPPQHPYQQSAPSPAPTPAPPGAYPGSPPPRPPSHPSSAGQYGGGGYGYGASGGGFGAGGARMPAPLNQALNLVGNLAGSGAKTQLANLAQSGSKLFGKVGKK